MRSKYFDRCKNSHLVNKTRFKEVKKHNIDEKIQKVNEETMQTINGVLRLLVVSDAKLKKTVG